MTMTLGPDMEAQLRENELRKGREPDVVAKMPLADVLDAEAREHQEAVAANLRSFQVAASCPSRSGRRLAGRLEPGHRRHD